MSQMKSESLFHAIRYTFASSASKAAENSRATDENTVDTELRMFFLKAGIPQAMLTQSKLKEKLDRVVYEAEVSFIGGMTIFDAKDVATKVNDAGVNVVGEDTTFEGDDRSPYGYLKLKITAKDASELGEKLEAAQDKRVTQKKPALSG